jgi:hypothetical protein
MTTRSLFGLLLAAVVIVAAYLVARFLFERIAKSRQPLTRTELITRAFREPQPPELAAHWQAKREALLAEAKKLGAPSNLGSWGELEEWVKEHRADAR